MYAVIETGGKQYRVSEGDVVRIEKLEAEAGSRGGIRPRVDGGQGRRARRWGRRS